MRLHGERTGALHIVAAATPYPFMSRESRDSFLYIFARLDGENEALRYTLLLIGDRWITRLYDFFGARHHPALPHALS